MQDQKKCSLKGSNYLIATRHVYAWLGMWWVRGLALGFINPVGTVGRGLVAVVLGR